MGQSNVAVCVRKPSGKQAKLTLPVKNPPENYP